MYKIIVYELILFQVQQKNRILKKKYFRKLKTIDKIDIKDLSNKMIDLKNKYNDSKYIIDFITPNGVDLIAKMNEKSEKAYKDYILKGGF